MKLHKKAFIILFFLALTSCYQSLDFSQAEDYVLKPVITSALTYFTAMPSQFFDALGDPKMSISDTSDFKGFEYNVIRNNLIKIGFNAAINNAFDRDVIIQVDFLDSTGFIVYSFAPILAAKNNLNIKYLEEIFIATNPNILNTTQIRIIATIDNIANPMNANDTSKFELKSSVTLYIESEF